MPASSCQEDILPQLRNSTQIGAIFASKPTPPETSSDTMGPTKGHSPVGSNKDSMSGVVETTRSEFNWLITHCQGQQLAAKDSKDTIMPFSTCILPGPNIPWPFYNPVQDTSVQLQLDAEVQILRNVLGKELQNALWSKMSDAKWSSGEETTEFCSFLRDFRPDLESIDELKKVKFSQRTWKASFDSTMFERRKEIMRRHGRELLRIAGNPPRASLKGVLQEPFLPSEAIEALREAISDEAPPKLEASAASDPNSATKGPFPHFRVSDRYIELKITRDVTRHGYKPAAHTEESDQRAEEFEFTDKEWKKWWIETVCKCNSVTDLSDQNWSPLMYAADSSSWSWRAMKAALALTKDDDIGAVINKQATGPEAAGFSALHFACSGSDKQLLRIELATSLIDHKADVDLKDYVGNTPLLKAAGSGTADVVLLLKERRADIHARRNTKDGKPGKNALEMAMGNSTMATKMLKSMGAKAELPVRDFFEDGTTKGITVMSASRALRHAEKRGLVHRSGHPAYAGRKWQLPCDIYRPQPWPPWHMYYLLLPWDNTCLWSHHLQQ